eukprot:2809866-Rhodomonas_salina.1
MSGTEIAPCDHGHAQQDVTSPPSVPVDLGQARDQNLKQTGTPIRTPGQNMNGGSTVHVLGHTD